MNTKLFRNILASSLLLCGMTAAHAEAPPDGYPVREIELPAAPGSRQHHLARTADGRLIVSWVETKSGKSTVRFAIREKAGWSSPKTVTNVEGKLADPPVVLGLTGGAVAAAWMPYVKDSTDRYAADIYLARSRDQGRTWSKPFKPYRDPARIYDAQMSLAPLPDGGLALVWTDTRHVHQDQKNERYQLMATVIGKDWKPGAEIVLDSDMCSCCRSFTAVRGHDLITVFRDHTEGEIRDIGAVRWNTGGKVRGAPVHDDHWVLNGCPSNGPSVDWAGRQTVAAWFTAADGHGKVKVSFSPDGGARFGEPIEVDADAAGYANAVVLDDGSALVSWRGRSGPDEELRVAKIAPGGEVSRQTTVYRGGFPAWPSKYPSMTRAGDEVFLAWTDPALKKVRLAAVNVGPARPHQ